MSEPTPSVPEMPTAKSHAQLRHEAGEIIRRHQRGLKGVRTAAAPRPAGPVPANALKSLLEGRDLLRKGNIAEALLRADAAIGLAPPGSTLLSDSWTLHGDVRLLQGNPQAARSAFERALDVNAAHVEARLGLGEAYRRMSQPGRAIPLYLETLPLLTEEPERARLRLIISDTYRAAGQPEAARRALRAGGMKHMDGTDRLRALATLLLPT
ncbi:MAG: tetratricopeptide repeat protein, partial [Ardenticatenaceae bacterium]